MVRIWLPSVALAIASAGLAIAATVQSGLQVGDFPLPFDVKDITGFVRRR